MYVMSVKSSSTRIQDQEFRFQLRCNHLQFFPPTSPSLCASLLKVGVSRHPSLYCIKQRPQCLPGKLFSVSVRRFTKIAAGRKPPDKGRSEGEGSGQYA
ncbi:Uncharacterized protein HZ326_25713 [Fusarium oxysporum f. sp. albedinis]|nr:Uncharacterized protein HZ326_25713 [Fusarium oxysporum f. sp. albedinis]